MKEQEKQAYLEKYKDAKEKGVPFYPDIIFKDVVASLVVFLILVALAYIVGAPLEERANPADTFYNPRPEWYFMFLFQLLKYFPGELEVIGVFVIPTLAIILLLVLPFLDRSARRHPKGRPVVIGLIVLSMAGFILLSVQSAREAPPPVEEVGGDQTAALYAKNCAPCHGSAISVTPGANLHDIIAQGKHADMPAWSADLTSDEIDALAGFILSPGGSELFTSNCGDCHQVSELVAGDPLELKTALEQGSSYPPHEEIDASEWSEVLAPEENTALLNFLVAPDGQRLFATNCASCHGRSVSYSGGQDELLTIIRDGGLHLEMPPWRERLSESELDTLARYVTEPGSVPAGEALFQNYCSDCHGNRVPAVGDAAQAKEIIASGGTHQTMPVWGDVLTAEQIDALVNFTLESARGTSLEVGQELFAEDCAPCHGVFGEGGPNPAQPGDIIAPISSSEYLTTRDDFTLQSIIAQGQPNFGMASFGSSFGGPLDEDEIDAIVAYMRSWEANPPVELPPAVATEPISLSGAEIYVNLCAQCHGPKGEGDIGPSLSDPQFQAENDDQDIFDTIDVGHEATTMIAWGELLTTEQIQQLVEYIRQLEQEAAETPTETPSEAAADKPTETPSEAAAETPTETPSPPPTFTADVLPIFEAECVICHGTLGGWDASSYEAVMTTGDNAPVVIPGDAEGSLLAQKILGTHTEGNIMPPSGMMDDEEIQIILDWIAADALDN